MKRRLTHQDESGRPRMVDVSDKSITAREATAEGFLRMSAETLALLREGSAPKGDPLVVARIAGIQAAKRTADLIPLCHPLPLDSVELDLSPTDEPAGVQVRATARVHARTGVEMEALTAAAIALLTLYDMLKGADRGMVVEGVRLVSKTGGRSGRWVAST